MHKIVPFFRKHTLRAKKKYDFELWFDALGILYRNQQRRIVRKIDQVGFPRVNWDPKDILKLKEIYKLMASYKSKRGDWKWIDKAAPYHQMT